MKNILLFEGAGMDYNKNDLKEGNSDVGNYRIRTAFIDGKGNEIYLEITGYYSDGKYTSRDKGWYMNIDHCFNLSMSTDENVSRINLKETFFKGYTKQMIIEFVNSNFNCNFKTIEILDDMENYRVHGDNHGKYNLMDNHIVNKERTIARKKAYEKIEQEVNEKLDIKYAPITVEKMDDESITIRCYTYAEDLYKIGLSDNNRLIKIEVRY